MVHELSGERSIYLCSFIKLKSADPNLEAFIKTLACLFFLYQLGESGAKARCKLGMY